MSHYTMLCKYGKQTRDFWGFSLLVSSHFLYFGAFLIKQLKASVEKGR